MTRQEVVCSILSAALTVFLLAFVGWAWGVGWAVALFFFGMFLLALETIRQKNEEAKRP